LAKRWIEDAGCSPNRFDPDWQDRTGEQKMDEQDFLPTPKPKFEQRILDDLSVHELNDYIAELEDEISRVRQDITAKESHRQSIDSLFKK
jgi:uncharacterized small protein (DUF1192 family)